MKKRTIVIIVAVVAVLLAGTYMLFDNLFPKAEPIKQLEVGMIESVSLSDNEDNEITISDACADNLLSWTPDGESAGGATRWSKSPNSKKM